MHRAGAVRDIAFKTARAGGDRFGKKTRRRNPRWQCRIAISQKREPMRGKRAFC
jgi:hypothetical protein